MKHTAQMILLLLLLAFQASGQQTHTLAGLLAAADAHLPNAQQLPLIQEVNRLALAQLRSNYLPQATLGGQATWQSEVTSLPIQLPNIEVPTISKDQYKVTLDVLQPIWDGGQTARQQDIQQAQSQVEAQRVAVEQYALHEQVIQLYCAALLSAQQTRSLDAAQKNLQFRRDKMQEQVKNGAAIPATVQSFDARLLELEQMQGEAESRRLTALDGLSLLTGVTVGPKDQLSVPKVGPSPAPESARPELTLFALQQATLGAQEKSLSARWMPRVNAVATLGYGRPGLNFLSNEFEPYAVLGANFKWNLSGFYNGTTKKERQQLRLQSERIARQRDQFLLLNNLKHQQQQRTIEQLNKTLERDAAIVKLRDQVAATTAIQVENGVQPPSEYLNETTNALTAQINKDLHELQLLQAQLMQAFIHGKL